jgi:hypothetical protein
MHANRLEHQRCHFGNWRGIPSFTLSFSGSTSLSSAVGKAANIANHGHPKWGRFCLSPWVSEGQIIFQNAMQPAYHCKLSLKKRERKITNRHPTILRVKLLIWLAHRTLKSKEQSTKFRTNVAESPPPEVRRRSSYPPHDIR